MPRNADKPHAFQPTPDGDCFTCGRLEGAAIHSDEAQAKVINLTPRNPMTAVKWADMTGPQRFVVVVALGGIALLFLTLVLAMCLHLLDWGLS